MSCELVLKGSLIVPGGGCASSCGGDGGAASKIINLSFACLGLAFGAVRGSDCPERVTTLGAIGSQFIDIPGTSGFSAIEFLYLRTVGALIIRIGAAPATILGTGGTFPTGFVGGETFAFSVDGVAVAVVFTSGAQTAQQVANQINAAAALAGMGRSPATAETSGQLRLTGLLTGSAGSVSVTTARAAIGFPTITSVAGSGVDTQVDGTYMVNFAKATAPARVQLSGTATIEVLAAGSVP